MPLYKSASRSTTNKLVKTNVKSATLLINGPIIVLRTRLQRTPSRLIEELSYVVAYRRVTLSRLFSVRWRLSWTHSIIVDELINLQPLMGCLVTCVPLGAALSPDLRDNVLPTKGNGVCSKESAADWRRLYQHRSRHSQGGAFDHSLRTLMLVVHSCPNRVSYFPSRVCAMKRSGMLHFHIAVDHWAKVTNVE
jgi:hypothetical protein